MTDKLEVRWEADILNDDFTQMKIKKQIEGEFVESPQEVKDRWEKNNLLPYQKMLALKMYMGEILVSETLF